jgi:adenylate kinase family enzyme
MSKVYIIGGGPGGGKSTIARRLSKRYGIECWRADDFVGEHQQEAADRKYPMNNYLDSLDENEQPLELIKLTDKQELARQEELFFIMLKELRNRKFEQLILEGNCLLPELVMKRFEHPYSAVWLIPTEAYIRGLYPQREWLPKILKKSDDPDFRLEQYIRRDINFNHHVREQAKQHELTYLDVDGSKSVDETYAWVERQLTISPQKAKK